jgi:uncharacterized protein
MNYEILDKSMQRLSHYCLNAGKDLHLIWHGGEPLMMGASFFIEAYCIQQRYNSLCRITNSIQTNGTLIDGELLDFCNSTRQFSLGLSLDGPETIHNTSRPYSNGTGSFDKVLKNIFSIQESTGRMPGVILVLSRRNLHKIAELYRFFDAHAISFKINPLVRSGRAADAYKDLGITAIEYGMAMIEFFDLWFRATESRIHISPIDTIIGNMITKTPRGCNFAPTCRFNYFSIGPQGDVYPCGRFDGLSEFRLGNICESDVACILDSDIHRRLSARNAEGIDECNKCRFLRICHGGCMHNAYVANGDIMKEDYYCAGYKMLFQHIENALATEFSKASQAPGADQQVKHEPKS